MDAIQPDPLHRLADALESLSAGQLALAEATDRLAGGADAVPRERLAGAAATSRRAARHASRRRVVSRARSHPCKVPEQQLATGP